MAITARFDFDEREYRRAQVELLGPGRWALPLGGITLALVALWFGVFRHWGEAPLGDALFNVLPWLLLGAFFAGLVPLLAHAQARKALDVDPTLNGPQVRTVDDTGLHITGAGYAPSRRWSELARATETSNFFFFFEDDRVSHYLPKRVLTDVERDGLRNLIQANCKS